MNSIFKIQKKKEKFVDGSSCDLEPVKKLKINEKEKSKHFIKKEVNEELLEQKLKRIKVNIWEI